MDTKKPSPHSPEAPREILGNFPKYSHLDARRGNYNEKRRLLALPRGNRGDYLEGGGPRGCAARLSPPRLRVHRPPPAGSGLWKAAKSHSGNRSLTSDPSQDLARLTARSGHASPTRLRPPVREAGAPDVVTAPLAFLERDMRDRASRRRLQARSARTSRASSSWAEGRFRRPHFRLVRWAGRAWRARAEEVELGQPGGAQEAGAARGWCRPGGCPQARGHRGPAGGGPTFSFAGPPSSTVKCELGCGYLMGRCPFEFLE